MTCFDALVELWTLNGRVTYREIAARLDRPLVMVHAEVALLIKEGRVLQEPGLKGSLRPARYGRARYVKYLGSL